MDSACRDSEAAAARRLDHERISSPKLALINAR